MKARYLPLLAIASLLTTFSCAAPEDDLSSYVNPFIGTDFNGHTFPGATTPLGMVQPGPQTGISGWDYCGGFRDKDSLILGFTQTRLSGTGCMDLGDILITPFSDRAGDKYASRFDRKSQRAVPGFYGVSLTDNASDVQITCSPRVAFFNFTYKGDSRNVFLNPTAILVNRPSDLKRAILSHEVDFRDDRTITGHSRTRVWVERDIYYVITFDTPFTMEETVADSLFAGKQYLLHFGDGNKPVKAKIAISGVSVDGAAKNLEDEIPGWDFEGVRAAAHNAWARIFKDAAAEGTKEQKISYYTSLYHLFLQPNSISDTDGRYRGADGEVRSAGGGKYYSTLSCWDTFRAANPFYLLTQPGFYADLTNDMIGHSDAQGYLPIWTLWGKENFCMIGNHSIPGVVDACMKDLPGVDQEKAFQAVKKSLLTNHGKYNWDIYDKYGYFPYDLMKNESVSMTLECGYDDYCAAVLARKLGHEEDFRFFMGRSEYYHNLWDPSTKLFRGKDTKGGWRTPFRKFSYAHDASVGGDYTEGNAWHYAWHVLQDPDGLISLNGGEEMFTSRLDSLFSMNIPESETGVELDVTGLIGQYAHGNEPSHHIIYFYTLAGRQDRTAELVREVFDKFYLPVPDGLCGNDDCGQMSAWYLFSAMGFYPVNPISGEYVLGAPQLPKVTLNLPGGKFTMTAKNLSRENKYVSSVSFNGQPLEKTISYDQISHGGELVFEMTDKPKK